MPCLARTHAYGIVDWSVRRLMELVFQEFDEAETRVAMGRRVECNIEGMAECIEQMIQAGSKAETTTNVRIQTHEVPNSPVLISRLSDQSHH